MDRLKDKVALITGGARGLGAKMAELFHAEGARVIINDLDLAAAQKAAEPMQGHAIAADVSDSAQVAAMFEEVGRYAGQLDILVNNAGIGGGESSPEQDEKTRLRIEAAERGEVMHNDAILEITDEQWDRMIDVHMRGTFLCCREGIKQMLELKTASIINIASVMGTFGRPGFSHYSAAKSGIMGFTRALAHEMASRNIRVNAIAPGWIETDMTAGLTLIRPTLEAQIPLGGFGQPEDIAWSAVYLASDEAKYMTGQVISPNGGWYMSQ
ncbi:MAG: 3-oxoacyl-[acyl-carrier protein] reductase [Paraglaciecola psychrophila]|jgi:3-oxoacyl-[acyl-carrier protein] reductase